MGDITKTRHIHFTGIKGVGMASLAICAKDLKIKVTGSDVEEVFVTDETLQKAGIRWSIGFGEKNLKPLPDILITTGAHGGLSNPEVELAKEKGIKTITLSEAQGLFAQSKKTIAVAGVGGKTTTCSMIAVLLESAGKNPSYAIGVGDIYPLGTPGKYSLSSEHFILEADEFAISPGIDNRPRFTYLDPSILVVTGIEHDHPDVYPSIQDTKKAFKSLMSKVPKSGLLLINGDNRNNMELVKDFSNAVTYGLSEDVDWRISNIRFGEGKSVFDLSHTGKVYKDVRLFVPALYNIENAAAAFIVGHHLGVEPKSLYKGIQDYKGCRRRFEKVGQSAGVTVYDDYAHHPKEIKAVLRGVRDWFPTRRVIVVFQPHTYSRTKALFSEFAQSFEQADSIVLMDIYSSARETDTLGINSQLLSQEIAKHGKNVSYTGSHKKTLDWLLENMKKGDIVITLGAGDIFHLHKRIMKGLNG